MPRNADLGATVARVNQGRLRRNRLAYELHKSRFIRRERRREGEPIVVLTLGKAGSTTIQITLEAHAGRPVYQVHRIGDQTLRAEQREYRSTAPLSRPPQVMAAHYLRGRMPTRERPWDVIVLVRDPVARSVSAYYQAAQRLRHPMDPEMALSTMLRWPTFRSAETWFQTELGHVGVDVYAHPFNPSRGWQVIDTGPVRLLILRQEDLRDAAEVMSHFLGVRIPGLVQANVSVGKVYADAYTRFCAEARSRAGCSTPCTGQVSRGTSTLSRRGSSSAPAGSRPVAVCRAWSSGTRLRPDTDCRRTRGDTDLCTYPQLVNMTEVCPLPSDVRQGDCTSQTVFENGRRQSGGSHQARDMCIRDRPSPRLVPNTQGPRFVPSRSDRRSDLFYPSDII